MIASVQSSAVCPICSSEDTFLEYPQVDKGLGAHDVLRCKRCGMSYAGTSPDPSVMREWYKDYHGVQKKASSAAHFFDGEKIRKRLETFFFNFPGSGRSFRDQSLLDVGCGEGGMLLGFKPYFKSVHGVERSEDSVAVCRSLGLDVKGEDLKDGLFPEKSFDVITLFDILEHVEEPQQMIATLFRILKEDGILCVTTPNASSLKYKIVGDRWVYCTPPDHLRLYTEKALRFLLERHGFEVVRVRPSSRTDIFPFFGIYDTLRYLRGSNKKMLRTASVSSDRSAPTPFQFNGSFGRKAISVFIHQGYALLEAFVSLFVNAAGASCHLYVFARKKRASA